MAKPSAIAPPSSVTASLTGLADITVAWMASAGAKSYRVYRNGLRVANPTTLRWVDTNLPAGSYGYQVSAVDKHGTESRLSPMTGMILIAASPPSSLITTLTLSNASGSLQAANFVTPMFGHPFKKGDIAGASYPKFELTDGTAVPATIWGKTTWSDGSWKFAEFMLRVPNSIAGSGTLTINVKTGGSAPAASARATSDLSAQDLKIVLTGIDNLTSGPWTSSL